tara:strand:+ start:674 stop:1276 length:603 start_codon:yes stop_codon:yes gene_type:complete
METLNEVNELLTTKMCSPVIIYGVILVMSLICIYLVRQRLGRYNTLKMENLYNLYSAQELKFLLTLGIIMYGLCQYNKTELAWIFLIFPIIYVLIQNVLLYIHVSSALQNAPAEAPIMQAQHYGLGMAPPLLAGKGPSPPQISTDEKPVDMPPPPQQEFTLPKMTNQSSSMGGGFGNGDGFGNGGGFGSVSAGGPVGFTL